MTEEICLFPIPGAVSFPYSVRPLHIFEPRYRIMIKDSIQNKRKIGVAHIKKELKSISGHVNFEAYSVFSAGHAEILETLPDGRMLVQIPMESRYQILTTLQDIPYKVVDCIPYEDEISNDPTFAKEAELRTELDKIFLKIIGNDQAELRSYLTSESWIKMTHDEYSYQIYSLVLFEPEILQKVLEEKSILKRISFLYDALTIKILQ